MHPSTTRPTVPSRAARWARRFLAAVLVIAAGTGAALTPAAATGREIGGSGNEFRFQDAPIGSPSVIYYGRADDRALVGDWDGDGIDTIAVRRGHLYYFSNAFRGGEADVVQSYGWPGDEVLVGDWDGDGIDTLGVRRGNVYHLKNDLSSGVADVVVAFGRPGDTAVVGDWDGDGIDTVAVHRNDTFYLQNSFAGGEADRTMQLGYYTDTPIAGDWDGDGRTDIGVRRASMVVTQTQRQAQWGGTSIQRYGEWTDAIITGDWNGDGKDTLGLRRPNGGPGVVVASEQTDPRHLVMEVARTRIGMEYVFGASGPEQFDCSGLTSWAFRHVGVNLPHFSGAQKEAGREIPASQAMPGDLIWWPGHVAIYTGDGMMIDAASPEMGISERRVMKNPTYIRVL